MKTIILFFLLAQAGVLAQSNFDFEFDYAQFGYDSTSNYVEFYYSFNQASLKVGSENSHTNLEGLLKIFIQNVQSGDSVVFNQWKMKLEIDTSSINNQTLVGTLGFVIPAGTFNCEVTGSDFNNPEMFRTIKEEIVVSPMLNGSLTISDIQLASKMVQGSENTSSVFYKNTYEVIPIPNLIFGQTQPALFFYTEIYNLQSQLLKSDQIKMSQLIYNSRGRLVKEKSRYLLRSSNSRVEVGSCILSNIPTDSYTLVVALIDSLANEGISTAKKFYVYNPDVPQVADTFEVSTTSVLSSTFGSMSEEELDDLFLKSKYLAAKTEIEKYENLSTIEGKREFMFEFWKARDENSATPENEFYKKYIQRLEVCNDKYNSMGKQGWKTDRGRIYLLFGEPTEIERYPNQLETKPYEIWHYTELEGGVYFIFADLTGFSDYQLVTSTKRGELRDDNWQRRITVQ